MELDEYACPVCGKYAIVGNLPEELHGIKKAFSQQYSFVHWKEFIKEFPENHKIPDRALLNLGIASKKFGQEIVLTSIDHILADFKTEDNLSFFLLFTEKDYVTYVLESLQEKNYIQYTNKDGNIFKIIITAQGWNRIAELKAASAKNSDKAFVAMWFSDETEPLYVAVKQAIEDAGYIPLRVDKIPHTDFIMNKVINLINESK